MTPGVSHVDWDRDLLSTLLSDTQSADMPPQPIAQGPIKEPVRSETQRETGGLKPKELQPLEAGDFGHLNGQLVTIPSRSGSDSGHDETELDDSDFQLPEALMPPIGGNSRLNAAYPSRERLPDPGELPRMSLPPTPPELRRGVDNSAVIANGAPIPMRLPPQQMGQRQASANATQNAPPSRVAQMPLSNMQQPAVPQQPAPNSLTQQQMQQRTLTPQQQRALQMQQMQQQRLAAQQGRNVTPTQPQNPQQMAVPPAPVVPNTPMMTPAPSFR